MPEQDVLVTCELGALDTKVRFFVTELEAMINLPPQKSSRYEITGFPPNDEEIQDALRDNDYRGKRMIVRVGSGENARSIGHTTIYSIKQNEDSMTYTIVGHNVTKDLKRERISATFQQASSVFAVRESINQIGNPADDDVGGGVTRPQQYLSIDGNDNFTNEIAPITQTVEDVEVSNFIDQTCNKNGWVWWINPRNHVCFGEPSEAYRVGEDGQRRGLLQHNIADVIEMSPGLQQPAWNQVIVYGGNETTSGINASGEESNPDASNDLGADEGGFNSDTVDAYAQNLSGGVSAQEAQEQTGNDQGEDNEDTQGQEGDGSDTNSGPENSSMSTQPVIGRAYIKSAPEGEGSQAMSDKPSGTIVTGDPPGSDTGNDLDEDNSGSVQDEADELQDAVDADEANQATEISSELAGPKPVFKWPDQSVHTQKEADKLAASILRSFHTKRKNGKITIPGKSDIHPLDIVTLPGEKPGTAADSSPQHPLTEPDLGGQTFLVTGVKQTIKEDGPWKTEVSVGGVIDGFVNGRQVNQDGNNDGNSSDTSSAGN